MTVVREIIATEWIERAWPLLEAHRQELTTDPEIMTLQPDVARYKALEDAGAMLSLGLFNGEDLVGYSINAMFKHAHHGYLFVCQNELLFVLQAHRRGMAGVRLIAQTEEAARSKGVDVMVWAAKPQTTLNAILPRLGYRTQEIMYSRVM